MTTRQIDFYNMFEQKEKCMKQKNWAKTLLASYNSLETIANAVDNLVVTQGINSANNHLTTIENAERIISLIQRKKLLVNLKVLVDSNIEKLDNLSARLLIMRYLDNIKPDICLEILKLTRRTYFRKLDRALEEFSLKLKHSGYTPAVLEQLVQKEHWIKEHYNHFLKQEMQKSEKDISEVVQDSQQYFSIRPLTECKATN